MLQERSNREMEMKISYFSIKRIIYSLILINLRLETNKKVNCLFYSMNFNIFLPSKSAKYKTSLCLQNPPAQLFIC